MGQALYRKYRSKSLSEIVGQEHITKTLGQAVKSGRIAHAYLFTGPKGVGKTSIARILAHDINGLKYSDDSSDIDIIEIDAASNRKLEETKALIEKVYVAPVSAKYKVYIIDEVHMLTQDSFNALLKTLEEPPAHVVFILATTEAHKLPETIISRTQRFAFKPIEKQKAVQHLKTIAGLENIQIDEAALELIAEHGQGSFRDSIGLLDQAANFTQPISAGTIGDLLGIPPTQLINQLLSTLETGPAKQLVSLVHDLIDQGFPATTIASELAKILRQQLISDELSLPIERALTLLAGLLDVSAASNPETYLEICLLKALPALELPKAQAKPPQQVIEKAIATDDPKPAIKSLDVVKASPEVVPEEKLTADKSKPTSLKPLNRESWDEVLSLLRSSYNTLYGIVRMASVEFSDNDTITLKFAFPFHQKRVNDPKNRAIIQAAIKKVSGQELGIDCVVDKNLLNKSPEDDNQAKEAKLETISSIFGGGELI